MKPQSIAAAAVAERARCASIVSAAIKGGNTLTEALAAIQSGAALAKKATPASVAKAATDQTAVGSERDRLAGEWFGDGTAQKAEAKARKDFDRRAEQAKKLSEG
jgi:hypothetical protein